MSRIDHVAIAVRDLSGAAAAIEKLYGLGAYAGGRTEGGHAIKIASLRCV